MLFINKRFIRYFDWISFALVLIITLIGITFVYSATFKQNSTDLSIFFKKQLFGCITGTCIYFFCSMLDYRTLCRIGFFLYFASIAVLIFTMIKGSVGMGAQRWIDLGIIKFQPSELSKLFFPMFVTYYFLNDQQVCEPEQKDFIIPFSIMLVSSILVLKQPDLGTALILLFSGSIMFWFTGLSKNFFIICGAMLLVTAPISWHFLKTYQKKRILVFLGYGNNQKERYQIEQSKIAVGSGGFWGKGFLKGTQNKLSFLPESRTDFIFSVMCEELGLAGATLILLLYLLLFLRLFFMINSLTTFYPQLLCLGLAMHIVISTIINIGMVLDLLPVVGIPLPFASYGITHLWIGFASLGCINSITSQRYVHDL
ncbi:MAG: rod shape-determining protein RodA [Candidatus Chromulinivorax sp.]